MNSIIKNYNLLIKKYQKIENDLTENEIHDKRVILRRIFPMLAAYKMKPSKIKNGEKAFKLFGKLRDIQIQIMKIEIIELTPELQEYLLFLKTQENEIKEKVHKFCKKRELEFPVIKKKNRPDKSELVSKTEKSLTKLIDIVQSKSIDDAEDVHKIRIEFKKFRYKVEILSYIEEIDETKLDMLKMYQDKLGDIQDYEVLINGIKKFCRKRKLDENEMIEIFEHDQNTLIENFDNQIELFVAVCRDAISSTDLSKTIADEKNEFMEVSDLTENDLQPEKQSVGSTDDLPITKNETSNLSTEQIHKIHEAEVLKTDNRQPKNKKSINTDVRNDFDQNI